VISRPYGHTSRACSRQSRISGKYQAAGQPIHLIGIEFSREQRNLVGFEVESV